LRLAYGFFGFFADSLDFYRICRLFFQGAAYFLIINLCRFSGEFVDKVRKLCLGGGDDLFIYNDLALKGAVNTTGVTC